MYTFAIVIVVHIVNVYITLLPHLYQSLSKFEIFSVSRLRLKDLTRKIVTLIHPLNKLLYHTLVTK